ncbi:MAG: DNA repair protein RecO [Magnetococcus sp. WYHC-3]
MALIEDRALVLRRIPRGEGTLVVHLLGASCGRMHLVARGARTPKSPLRGSLAGFHTLAVTGRWHPARDLGVLQGADVVVPRHGLMTSSRGLPVAQLLQEMAWRVALPQDPQPALFTLIGAALDRLECGADALAVAAAALQQGLALAGFGWQLQRCVGCGREAAAGYFSRKRLGLVCPACGAPYARHLQALSPALVARLRQEVAGMMPEACAEDGTRWRLALQMWNAQMPHPLEAAVGVGPRGGGGEVGFAEVTACGVGAEGWCRSAARNRNMSRLANSRGQGGWSWWIKTCWTRWCVPNAGEPWSMMHRTTN